MPPTKTPLSPDADPSHANGDDFAKRSARSYRTYDEEDRYTPFSDDTFESDYERSDRRKKSGGTYTGKPGAKRSDGSKVRGSKALRQFATKSRVSPGSRDNVAQRVLSARRLKMNELKNEIELLSKELFEMKKENVLLRRTQVMQERSLERFEDKESNLPQLMESHSREVRALREQLRKYKERAERSQRAARDLEDDLAQTRKQLRKLQALADDGELPERDELRRRVSDLEASVEAKTERVKELERHVENLEKNHGRELRTEMKKVKDARVENELLQQSVEKLQQQLKEKEKELEIANIYHGRFAKAQQRSLPALDAPPSPRPPPYNRKAHTPDASPRDKARQLDEKRREAMKKRRETVEKQLALVKVADGDPSKRLPPQLPQQEQRMSERQPARADPADAAATREDSWDKIRLEQERIDAQRRAAARPATPTRAAAVREGARAEKPPLQYDERDERRAGVTPRRPPQQQTEEDRLTREAKEEVERRERAAAEQREADARLDRERWEREERHRREQEREQREREERERRLQLERLEKEQREEEERRARAREEEQRRIKSDAAAAEERRKKDMLLQMMKNIDNNKDTTVTDDDSAISLAAESKQGAKLKKDYTFRDADEKLHRGVPAAKPLRNTTINIDEPFDKTKGGNQVETGGYAPSFDTRGAASKPTNDERNTQTDKTGTAKKSKLLDSLFGTDPGKASGKGAFDDDIFSSSTKAKPVADRRAYPWEVDAESNNNSKAKDEVVLMPLRQRLEPSAVHNKPTVKAVSATSFEDDIEELVL